VRHPLDQLVKRCFENSYQHGFWEGEQNRAEKIALMHSELSEALEAIRRPIQDDHCPEFTSEEVEMADVIIRVFDYCGAYKLRLSEAFEAKMKFNAGRPHKHGKAF
jgi:NTP pyrophosphatase (non-canonical NTP hydrolase)